MSDPRINVRIRIDRESLRRTVRQLVRLMDALRRHAYGRGQCARGQYADPEWWWQSDLCAAWLHGSCPAPDLCDCRCDHPERKATR